MALKATIFKADLSIADMDRNYYADHALTLARHPSETDERMMVRLAAFALNAHERLAFGGGISTEDEPALWRRDLTGAIEQWIDVGLPEARDLRRACGRASEVIVYAYGGRAVARAMQEQLHDPHAIMMVREPVSRAISFFTYQKARLRIPADQSIEIGRAHV